MVDKIQMVADGCSVGRDRETGEILCIAFTGGDDTVTILMDVQYGPLLLSQLEGANVHSRSKPISQDELEIGSIFHLAGHGVGRTAEGGKRLTLHVVVDNGVRSLPIDLSPKEVATLIGDLSAT